MDSGPISGVDLVALFLRGQNLEQIGREGDAVDLYEQGVTHAFDAPGPYDRLIVIYSNRAQHEDVVRVAEAALSNVHTHAAKREWYEKMRDSAAAARGSTPKAAPKRR